MQPKCYSYIRFSTPEQREGDSLRRQTEAAEKWASQHGMTLDNTTRLKDLGLSAYHGAHKDKGALGGFLELVTKGKIVSGSVLLVESLDRLSREEITEALETFLAIIRRGIKIVTMADNDREYTKETVNANVGDLIVSLTIMSRAHEESLMKSKRGLAAWEGKRARLNDRKLTGRAPAWLELSKDKTEFHAVPERAKIVLRIFEMKVQGVGGETIAKVLNHEEVWSPKNGWRKSYITKILSSRAVLGEFQPQAKVGDKRLPAGDPLPNYFPQVVANDLFNAVQARIASNLKKGGKNGRISNLFSHIAKCGYCGSPMAFINKGPSPKGGRYLLCDVARRGVGCERHSSIRYPDFEELILTYCKGLEVAELLPNAEQAQTATEAARERLAAIRAEYTAIQAKIVNVGDTIADTPDKRVRERLQANMTAFMDEAEALEKKERAARQELTKLAAASENTAAQLASLAELVQFMAQTATEDVAAVRMRLRAKLRDLIEQITIYPVGIKRAWMAKLLHYKPDMEHGEAVRERLASGGYDTGQQYIIRFASGTTRTLEPGKSAAPLTAEYDPETGRTITINGDGEVDISLDEEKEWEIPSIRPQKTRRRA